LIEVSEDRLLRKARSTIIGTTASHVPRPFPPQVFVVLPGIKDWKWEWAHTLCCRVAAASTFHLDSPPSDLYQQLVPLPILWWTLPPVTCTNN